MKKIYKSYDLLSLILIICISQVAYAEEWANESKLVTYGVNIDIKGLQIQEINKDLQKTQYYNNKSEEINMACIWYNLIIISTISKYESSATSLLVQIKEDMKLHFYKNRLNDLEYAENKIINIVKLIKAHKEFIANKKSLRLINEAENITYSILDLIDYCKNTLNSKIK